MPIRSDAIYDPLVAGNDDNQIVDADGDTKVQVEESSDDDTIRFDTAGNEVGTINTEGVFDLVPVVTVSDDMFNVTPSSFSFGTEAMGAPVFDAFHFEMDIANSDVATNNFGILRGGHIRVTNADTNRQDPKGASRFYGLDLDIDGLLDDIMDGISISLVGSGGSAGSPDQSAIDISVNSTNDNTGLTGGASGITVASVNSTTSGKVKGLTFSVQALGNTTEDTFGVGGFYLGSTSGRNAAFLTGANAGGATDRNYAIIGQYLALLGQTWLTSTTDLASSNPSTHLTVSGVSYDLFVEEDLEVDGVAYFDNATTAIQVGAGAAGVDYRILFDGETNDGILTWMEDEDYFQSSDKWLFLDKISFTQTDENEYIDSEADGDLDLAATTTIDFNISGTEEVAIAANTMTFNAGATDPVLDWSTDGVLNLSAGTFQTANDIKAETKITSLTVINPNGVWDTDTQVPIMEVKSALTVTKIEVSLNTTGNEVAGDLKWADDLTSFTGATVINDFDTTSGVRSDSTITAGSVAAGKWMYIEFDSQPNAAITFMNINVHWDYD